MGEIVRISGFSNGFFATHLLVVFIFLFSYLISCKDFRTMLLTLICSSFLTVFLILPQIRTIWILLFLVFLFFIFKNTNRWLIVLTHILLAFVFLYGVVQSKKTIDETKSVYGLSSLKERKMTTGEIRIILWRTAVNIFVHNPIWGTGPGTFGKVYRYYLNREELDLINRYNLSDVIDAHSQFFTRLSDIGLFCSTLYLLLFVFLIISSMKYYDTKKGWISLGFYAFFLISFFSDLISDTLGIKLFWIFSGIFIKVTSENMKYE
ncbi:MAG: hypothetical protein Fur0012_08100 [Elusimicrobiota bacterium]